MDGPVNNDNIKINYFCLLKDIISVASHLWVDIVSTPPLHFGIYISLEIAEALCMLSWVLWIYVCKNPIVDRKLHFLVVNHSFWHFRSFCFLFCTTTNLLEGECVILMSCLDLKLHSYLYSKLGVGVWHSSSTTKRTQNVIWEMY